MASLVHNASMLDSVTGDLDLEEGQDDIRIALLMTNTTADTEEETATVSAFTTLDEFDATGYSRKTLSSQAVAIDTTNDRVEFDCEDLTWTGLTDDATRSIQGMLVYRHVTNDADSVPIVFVEFASPVDPAGADFTVTMDAEGVLQIAQA